MNIPNLTLYIILSICLLPFTGLSQDFELNNWKFENEGGQKEDEVTGVATDSQGNVYITGYFSGTINLDPEGTSAGRLTSVDNNTDASDINTDIFVAKYGADGKLIRAIPLDYKGFNDRANNIALSNDGTLVYVVGQARGESGDDVDIYVALLDNDLDFIKRIQSSSAEDEQASNVAVHDNGNVYITGIFEKTIELYPESFGLETTPFTDTAPNEGLFVLVFDKNLNSFITGTVAKGNDIVRSSGIDIDNQGDAYITGEFSGNLAFPDAITRTSNGNRDAFYGKYDVSANDFDFAFSFGAGNDDRSRSLALDNNAFYITGDFRGTVDFDPNHTNASSIKAASSLDYDFFLAKYALNGSFQQVYQVGGKGDGSFEQGYEVTTRGNNVYVTGRVSSVTQGVGDSRFFEGVQNINEADAFMAVFDSDISAPSFVQRFGSNHLDFGNAIAVADGFVYVGGFADWNRDASGDEATKNSFLARFKEMKEELDVFIHPDFASQTVEKEILGGRDAVFADIDTDGDLDLTVAFKLGSKIQWYRNNEGQFSGAIPLENNLDDPRTVASADFDGVNGPDVVMADDPNSGSELRWYKNQGNSFGAPLTITTDYQGSSDVYAGDMDNDGDADIVLANFFSQNLVWFRNEGGTFSNGIEIDETDGLPREVVVGNIDNDPENLLDLVLVIRDKEESEDADEDQVLFYKNLGSGNFNLPVVIANNSHVDNPRGAALADFDNDKDLDVVVISNDGGSITLIKNQGDGTFATPQSIGSTKKPFAVDATDVDGDGDLDILVGSENDGDAGEDGILVWFKNNGSAAFTKETLVNVPKGKPKAIISDDIDNDGDQDIVVAYAEDGDFEVSETNLVLSLTNNIQSSPTSKLTELSVLTGDPADVITVYGANFGSIIGTAVVYFGETEAVVTQVFAEGTKLEVVVPEVADGYYDIKVVLPNGNEVVFPEKFLVGEIPTEPFISQVTPEEVAVGGELTIEGGGFGTNPEVKLDETVIAEVSIIKADSTISITVPELAVGEYALVVTPEGGEPIPYANNITIVDDIVPVVPKVDSIAPTQGPINTDVTIFGRGLAEVGLLFNGGTMTPTTQTDSQIVFKVHGEALEEGESYSISIVINETDTQEVGSFTINSEVDVVAPEIVIGGFTDPYGGGDITLSADVTDEGSGVNAASVTLFYKAVSSSTYSSEVMSLEGESRYTVTLSAASLASLFSATEIGMEFYVAAADNAGNEAESAHNVIYQTFTDITLERVSPIVDAKNPKDSDYQMIAIPLKSQSVTGAFEELEGYKTDGTGKWALYKYLPSQQAYQQHQQGFTSFEPGVGYMFAYRNFTGNITMTGEAVDLTDNAVSITLAEGQNLIGNPFLFRIDWGAVIDYNKGLGVAGIDAVDETLIKWKGGDWVTGETALQSFEGAFVEVIGEASVTLKIPVTAHARLSSVKPKNSFSANLDANAWFIPLNLQSSDRTYSMGGIGMHPEAQLSGDRFDDFTPPRLLDHLELNFPHEEFFLENFTKDIVPTQSSYVWDFVVAAGESSQATLTWDAQNFGNSSYELILLDLENLNQVNLRDQSSYTFALSGEHKFQLFYGTQDEITDKMQPTQFAIGQPYPNPTSGQLSIPVSVPEGQLSSEVSVTIFNTVGQLVKTLNRTLPSGYHTLQWSGKDTQGQEVSEGMYVYRVKWGEGKASTGKVLIRR
ncbi:MAG: FG-GAP-like repeat-containing protein [Cyclobacteriaceae bacterium]